MLYLYLDESGDLGFDFVNKKPSRFFTVTILVTKGYENNKKLSKAIKITLRRKFNIKKQKADELKGSKCPQKIKEYFYRHAQKINFGLYSITLNKIRVYERLRRDKERVYNYVARLVLDQISLNNAHQRIEIIIDKSKTKKNISEFNEYILRQIKARFDPKISLIVYHTDSKQNLGLQAVDLFCWGIFRKYEAKDKNWYNIFKEKIIYDKQYL
jgi:tRNA G18 (ribose-2'-O)-methylase SpoU